MGDHCVSLHLVWILQKLDVQISVGKLRDSVEFDIAGGVRQGSVLSPRWYAPPVVLWDVALGRCWGGVVRHVLLERGLVGGIAVPNTFGGVSPVLLLPWGACEPADAMRWAMACSSDENGLSSVVWSGVRVLRACCHGTGRLPAIAVRG